MTTKPATLLHPMGSMGEEIEPQPLEQSEFPTLTRTRGVHGSEPYDFAAGESS